MANEKSEILRFENSVKNLHEIEYGDFKRKLSLYILRLEEGLSSDKTKYSPLIFELRNKIIFSAEGDIDIAKDQVLEITKNMIRM